MSRLINLIGQKFYRLTVVQRMSDDKRGSSKWLCRCDCGEEKIILGYSLKNGNTKSCGCLRREGNNKKHGHSTTIGSSKTYHSWQRIVQRCMNPNVKNYKDYGGRGIKVCKRWLKFENFLQDMGEPPTQNHSIDRIKNDLGYCKSNCKWSTRKQQQRNRRNSRLITFNGKTQCIIEWSEKTGVLAITINARLKRGWSIEKALTTPVVKRKYK